MHYNFPHVYKSQIFGQLFLLNICDNQLKRQVYSEGTSTSRDWHKKNIGWEKCLNKDGAKLFISCSRNQYLFRIWIDNATH